MERAIVTIQQPTSVKLPILVNQEPPTGDPARNGQQPPAGREPPAGQQPPAEPPTQPQQEPPKRPWRDIFAGLGYFGIYLLVQVAVSLCALVFITIRVIVMGGLAGWDTFLQQVMSQVQASAISMTVWVDVLTVLIFWLIFVIRKKKFFQQIRLVRIKGATVWPLILLGLALNILLSNLLGMLPEAWLSSYQDASDVLLRSVNVLTPLLLAVLGPITEEVLFRGLVYTRFARAMPRIAAAILASLLFGLMHGHPVWMVYSGLLGVVLCLVMERYGSLWGAIALHIAFNAGSFFVAIFAGVPAVMQILLSGAACVWMGLLIKNHGPIPSQTKV